MRPEHYTRGGEYRRVADLVCHSVSPRVSLSPVPKGEAVEVPNGTSTALRRRVLLAAHRQDRVQRWLAPGTDRDHARLERGGACHQPPSSRVHTPWGRVSPALFFLTHALFSSMCRRCSAWMPCVGPLTYPPALSRVFVCCSKPEQTYLTCPTRVLFATAAVMDTKRNLPPARTRCAPTSPNLRGCIR